MFQNETAIHLYHDYAKQLPIIDYHCHLPPEEIAKDHKFDEMTELWLAGDHYKWRAMRANGVSEELITGSASAREKFKAWAETAEVSIGNPLYHWTQLELKAYFDVEDLLTSQNWEEIYDRANEVLKNNQLSARKFIEQSNVNFVGTTDSPLDSLDYHEQLANDETFNVTEAPSFRPDEFFTPTPEELKALEEVTGKTADSYKSVRQMLENRVDYFEQHGALISDHGLSELHFLEASDVELDVILDKWKKNEEVSERKQAKWTSRMLVDLTEMYAERNWVMQIHFGALWSANSHLFERAGANVGADSIQDQVNLARNLNHLLDAMDKRSALPKMILYNLNPEYNALVASTVANFQGNEEGIKGKIQFGAGWWFNDTEKGMLRQLETLADHGLLMHFVGMLTDSRSFLSYPRHDYFRRIFCNYVGEQVESGKFPNEEYLLKQLVENVCYENAKEYFDL